MSTKKLTMSIFNGTVICRRCQSLSRRSGEQCGAAADRHSKTSKCKWHGGRSTGPKTEQGRQRCAEAKTIHGKDTRAKRAQNAAASAKLNYLRDLGNLLGMFTGKTGWPGRKPNAYRPPVNPDPLELVRLIEALDTTHKPTEP